MYYTEVFLYIKWQPVVIFARPQMKHFLSALQVAWEQIIVFRELLKISWVTSKKWTAVMMEVSHMITRQQIIWSVRKSHDHSPANHVTTQKVIRSLARKLWSVRKSHGRLPAYHVTTPKVAWSHVRKSWSVRLSWSLTSLSRDHSESHMITCLAYVLTNIAPLGCIALLHCAKKPVTTMLTYPWKCTVLHCNHLGNTWKPLVLMTRHFDYCPSASEC